MATSFKNETKPNRRLLFWPLIALPILVVLVVITRGDFSGVFNNVVTSGDIPVTSTCSIPMYGDGTTPTRDIVQLLVNDTAPGAPNTEYVVSQAQILFGRTIGKTDYIKLCAGTSGEIATLNGVNLGRS